MRPVRTLASNPKRESFPLNSLPASTAFKKASGVASIPSIQSIIVRLSCLVLLLIIVATAGRAQNATITSDGWVVLPVMVTSGSAGSTDFSRESRRIEDQARKNSLALLNAPSQNVFNLQRRVAGVLPVRVEVPRAGKSYKFVRPLVLEEETKVTFQYKSK